MISIHQFITDKKGTLDAWLAVLAGLFCLILGYTFGVPLDYIIADRVVELGAPNAPIEFLKKLLVWFFVGMGLLLIIYGFARSYKRTHDTGIIEYEQW